MALAPLPERRFRYDVRKRRNEDEPGPLVPGCPCPACTRFSRAYVHYLSRAEELTGVRLLTIHNLVYARELVAGGREAILAGRFAGYRDAIMAGAAPWEARRPGPTARRPADYCPVASLMYSLMFWIGWSTLSLMKRPMSELWPASVASRITAAISAGDDRDQQDREDAADEAAEPRALARRLGGRRDGARRGGGEVRRGRAAPGRGGRRPRLARGDAGGGGAALVDEPGRRLRGRGDPGEAGAQRGAVGERVDVAVLGLVLERPQDRLRERLGDVLLVAGRRQRPLVLAADRQLGEAVALVGEPGGEQLVGDDAERVDVGDRRRLLAAGLLGRQVGGGADDRADLREPRLLGGPGDPEVGELDGHLGRAAGRAADHHQVPRLDVAVDDPHPVGVLEAGAGLGGDLDRGRRLERAVALQELGPGAALDVLHDDEVAAGVDAGVVDLDDVRVDELGDGERLAAEAGDELLVVGEVLGEDLDGDGPLEHAIDGPVDGRHAAAAEAVAELVAVGDRGAAHRFRSLLSCFGLPLVLRLRLACRSSLPRAFLPPPGMTPPPGPLPFGLSGLPGGPVGVVLVLVVVVVVLFVVSVVVVVVVSVVGRGRCRSSSGSVVASFGRRLVVLSGGSHWSAICLSRLSSSSCVSVDELLPVDPRQRRRLTRRLSTAPLARSQLPAEEGSGSVELGVVGR